MELEYMTTITETDINDLKNIKDLKLHVKNLSEDLWNFHTSVKILKTEISVIKVKQSKTNKILYTLTGISLLALVVSKFK